MLTPGTLIDGARMYAAAADTANDRYPNSMHVLSHLFGVSIELALKAFLLNRGRTEQELRKIGHDLRRLLEECESLGLTETGSCYFRFAVLGANYQDRQFAYPEEAVLNTIIPRSLREIVNELIQELFISVKGEKLFTELQSQPGLCIQSVYPEDVNASAWAATPGCRKIALGQARRLRGPTDGANLRYGMVSSTVDSPLR